MKRFFAFLLLLSAFSYGELGVRIAEGTPRQFFLGERAFVSVYIDGVSGNGSSEGHQGTYPYSLSNLSGNAPWLLPSGRPDFDSGLDNARDHWQNNQNFWLELSGQAPSAGEYSGVFRVTNSATGEFADVPYAFTVSGPPAADSGIAVMMRDPAASYGRQMEIYTSLKNVGMVRKTLQSPYVDYYGTRKGGNQSVVKVWGRPSSSCLQVLDCGNGNFVIRHRFLSSVTLDAGKGSGEFRVGYNEVASANNPDYYAPLPEKNLAAFLDEKSGYDPVTNSNAYADHSMAGFSTNYTARAMRRNLFYNPVEALYDHSGNLLWGNAPGWYSPEGCTLARVTASTRYDPSKVRTDSGITGFCTEGMENVAPEIHFPSAGPDTLYEGEDYFLRPLVSDGDGDEWSLELTSAPDWLEVGTPADYWDDYENVLKNNVNTAANRRVVYIRSQNGEVRQRPVRTPGTYTYTVKATDSFGASSSVTRTVVVLDGGLHPNTTVSGLSILVGDETWFKKYQLDVASGVVNHSEKSVTLSAGWHYDYYGVHGERSTLPAAHHWYTNPGMDVEYRDCGSGRFRLRYTGRSSQVFAANRSYLDSKTGFVYSTTSRMAKDDDWSVTDFYGAGDTLRRRRYAPKVPLYDGDGSLLWGSAPGWAGACEDAPAMSSSSSDASSSSGTSSSSSFGSSSSPSPSSSSSSLVQPPFDPYSDLAVRFWEESPTSNASTFRFDIWNRGNAVAGLGGYELFYYYNGDDTLDASSIVFDIYRVQDVVSSASAERCGENLFAYRIRLSDSASLSPGSKLPSEALSYSVHRGDWQPYDRRVFASWQESSGPMENPKMALFDSEGGLVYGTAQWPCGGYAEKSLRLSVRETVNPEYFKVAGGVGNVSLEIRNDGDSSLSDPVFVDFYVAHPAGRVPVIAVSSDTLSMAGYSLDLGGGLSVSRTSSGDRHAFRFRLADGIPADSIRTLSFRLLDQCLLDCPSGSESSYAWELGDDWSAMDGAATPWISTATSRVAVYSSRGELLYGEADPSAPVFAAVTTVTGDTLRLPSHPRPPLSRQSANRTDGVIYSEGQLLSGGDFESAWLHGWTASGESRSVRGGSPQGSRHLELPSGSSVRQSLPSRSAGLLSDSGAVFRLWHSGGLSVYLWRGDSCVRRVELPSGPSWREDSLLFERFLFSAGREHALELTARADSRLDDALLQAGGSVRPATYRTRFSDASGGTLEERTYDGDAELLVSSSEPDALGRAWLSHLPFGLRCSGASGCNPGRVTLRNPGMAALYYTASSPDYPDAGGQPYGETRWKPDPLATEDARGLPGIAYGLDSGHVDRVFLSGVDLSGVDLLDSASLGSAVSAECGGRAYDGRENCHARRDADPTHLWELRMDRDGRRSFAVKDGEGRTIVSGALDGSGALLSRGVDELDSRGNVVRRHPPASCSYTPRPPSCVEPGTYEYDSQGRVVGSVEPDAGESRTYYDIAGRVRATQTQRQMDSGRFSVYVYDALDREILRGEWASPLDPSSARIYFEDVSHQSLPSADSLVPGTVTRTFYDRTPPRDTLGVELYPEGVSPDAFRHGKGFVTAVVSDVSTAGAGGVIRVSTAYSHDRYGRVVASYAYDPTAPADSLKTLRTETAYDLGGKPLSTTRYPYGSDTSRSVKESYSYDRYGRVGRIVSKNGTADETELARYEYFPTGGVKTVTLGNSLVLSYTYHIGGALKTATVVSAEGGELYADTLHYGDCGDGACTPQYNGNVSRLVHRLAHGNGDYGDLRDVRYAYDELNRLVEADDSEQDGFDEVFAYDAQGRMAVQRRGGNVGNASGGEYGYYANTNRLMRVSDGMGGSADNRGMSADSAFVYDRDGNLVEDRSKNLKIAYDWRGMPVEFVRKIDDDSLKLVMLYDGSGRRISKTRLRKETGASEWTKERATHYTGIGTEIRENFTENDSSTKVVVNMPQGLGRYGMESDDGTRKGNDFYLKNHLGSTMMVARVAGSDTPAEVIAAYDYRSFGEQVDLMPPAEKVTETFTGKELDDETELNYFGARYLDPMLGLWISVDAAGQFASPYVYVGNGLNPINGVDVDGNRVVAKTSADQIEYAKWTKTLSFKDAKLVNEIERSDFVVYWGISNKPIETGRITKDCEPIYAGGVTIGVENERAVDITVYKEALNHSGIHEFYHADQANDLLQSDSDLMGSDWNDYVEENRFDLEQDAFSRQGENYTKEELKENGYR